MRRYFTLWGQRFELESLSPDEFAAIHDIRELNAPTRSDDDFLVEARALIRQNYRAYAASARILSGAVGAVYRDLWYRRQLAEARAKSRPAEAARILKNIRTHPARIIHDAFLDSGVSQTEFARRFGVSTATMSKLVQCFKVRPKDGGSEPAFRTATVIETLAQLAMTPSGVYFDQPSPRAEDDRDIATAPTVRERLLLRAVIEGVRRLKGGDETKAALADELARLFNDVNVYFLGALVECIATAARDTGDAAAVRNLLDTERAESLLQPTERSNWLFGQWTELFSVSALPLPPRSSEGPSAATGNRKIEDWLDQLSKSVGAHGNTRPEHDRGGVNAYGNEPVLADA